MAVAALPAPGQKLVGGGTDGAGSEAFQKLLGSGGGTATPGQKLELVSGAPTPTALGQKLFGGCGGTDGAGSEASRWRWQHCHAWSEACRWRHRRRRVRSFSVAALTAPGQKLLGGGGGTATPG